MSKFDWDAIEREYRTGQWTDKELARRHGFEDHGCESNTGPSPQGIGKRARTHKWERDLSKKVQSLAQARLIVSPGEQISQDEAVERAVEARVIVLQQHRANCAALRGNWQTLQTLVEAQGKRLADPKRMYTSAKEVREYADLVATAERALSRLQEAERAALDIEIDTPTNEDFDGPPLTDEERNARLVALGFGPFAGS